MLGFPRNRAQGKDSGMPGLPRGPSGWEWGQRVQKQQQLMRSRPGSASAWPQGALCSCELYYRVSFTLKQHNWQCQWERHKLPGEGASFQLGANFFLLMKDFLHNLHLSLWFAAAAAKSLQSCPTLCDPRDRSLPGPLVPGILQARTLEWVAISFSNAWKWKAKVKSLSCVRLLVIPWTTAHQAPPSMGYARQEYWSGLPLRSPCGLLMFANSTTPALIQIFDA